MALPRIGIVAASSVVPPVEFAAGVEHLREQGFGVAVHPQVLTNHWLHAGDDESRAQALYEYAVNPDIDVIWLARGGYGAAKIMPILDRLCAAHGLPPAGKLLVGYSDVTVLHEYTRNRWRWNTLHAPMPAANNFACLAGHDWDALLAAVSRSDSVDWPWNHTQLRWVTPPPSQPIEATLVGGNMSLWEDLTGTPYAPLRQPHLLFLEDLAEAYYRIDRMMTHLEQAGALDTTVGLVLGDFTDCNDERQTCLATGVDVHATWNKDTSPPLQQLRPVYQFDDLLREVFEKLGRRRNLPIALGLPVGHGPHFAPLPLGATYRVDPAGSLRLKHWGWLDR